MGTLKENLIAARALIDTPDKWVQGTLISGDCFCAVGAIGAAYGWQEEPFETQEYQALEEALPAVDLVGYTVAKFNDLSSTTHADIMALFDRAIEAQP